MLIYIILIVLTITGCIFLKDKQKFHFIYNSLLYVLPLSFRNISMGLNDVEFIYLVYFNRMENTTFNNLSYFITKDYLFYYLMYFCKKIWNNYNFFLTVVAIPYITTFFRLVKKYSKDVLMSSLMFLALNYWGSEFTLLRHCLALTFIIYSYDFILKNDFIKFLICIIVASLFHFTAFIFFPAFFLKNLNFKFKFFPLMGILFIFLIFFKPQLVNLINTIISGTRFDYFQNNMTELNPTLFVINFGIVLASYIFLTINKKKFTNLEKEDINLQLNITYIGAFISIFVLIIGEALRLSMFYSIFNVLLLPNTIVKFPQKERIILKGIFYIIFILYFFVSSLTNMNLLPYIFA